MEGSGSKGSCMAIEVLTERIRIPRVDFIKDPGEANRLARLHGTVDIVEDDKVIATICIPQPKEFCEMCGRRN